MWLNEEVSYSSPARVLLLGMGADEQVSTYFILPLRQGLIEKNLYQLALTLKYYSPFVTQKDK